MMKLFEKIKQGIRDFLDADKGYMTDEEREDKK